MRKLSIAVVACLFLWGALAFAAFSQTTVGPPIKAAGPVNPAAQAAAEPTAGPVLRIIQRRKLGLTTANVCRVLRDMKASGELEQFKSTGEDGKAAIDCSSLAVAVADRLASESPQAWAEGEIDWDAIIKFLEQLLELILKYLPLILELFV